MPSYVKGGVSPEDTTIKEVYRPVRDSSERLLIGVLGKWYDLTGFVKYHPGGDVLLEFKGKDATEQFLAYHGMDILKRFKARGTYDYTNDDGLGAEYVALNEEFEKLGFYKFDLVFFLRCLARTLGFFCLSLYCVFKHLQNDGVGEWAWFVVGAVSMGGAWQQSGFLMHDFMHNTVTHNRSLDQGLGWLFGNVLFGVSGKWWRDEVRVLREQERESGRA